MKCLLVIVVFGLIAYVFPSKIDPEVWSNIKKNGTANVLVKYVGTNIDECYNKLDALNLIGQMDIVKNLVKILQTQADLIQKPVIEALKSVGIKVTSSQIWLTGELIIYAAEKACIEELEKNGVVKSVTAEKFIQISPNSPKEVVPDTQWGIEKINAPSVWRDGNEGMDVVVGIIDSGAIHTHEALRENYRGWKGQNIPAEHNYNWLDATAISEKRTPSKQPVDTSGHGTHLTGTICGNRQNIGVAPKAKWIACSAGTANGSLSNQALLLCGQFMLCPRNLNNENEDCEKRVHVINNSWGGAEGNNWYDDIVRGWNKADIVSFFAAGNEGHVNCGTVKSPADGQVEIAVGNTDEQDIISLSSSVGPSIDGRIKPDLAAPGEHIVSACPTGDNVYRRLSGTSMATPHVAGTAALIIGYFKKNNIKYTVSDVINALKDGAQPIHPSNATCNGIRDDVYPNNYVGFGRINAQASLSKDVISKYGNKNSIADSVPSNSKLF